MKRDYSVDAFDQVAFGEDGDTPFEGVDLSEFGVDPNKPTEARPGSDDKVKMLAARYAAGLPLWHTEDCYDHSQANATFNRMDSLGSFSSNPFAEDELEDQDEDCELLGELD